MKLGTLEINAKITKISPVKKLTVYQYLWRNTNSVEEAGLGPRNLTVEGTVKTASDRDTLEKALEAAGEKKLYFPSEMGESDDRYYLVKTQPAEFTPETASLYRYSFVAIAADPRVYDATTDEPVWTT